jgi:long-chain acyl-CoA synthetase
MTMNNPLPTASVQGATATLFGTGAPATIVDLLHDAYHRSPASEAIVFGERRLTYQNYACAVAGFAADLVSRGLKPGARVVTVLENSAEACIAYFGTWSSGATLVPLNPLYTPRELGSIIADAEPELIVVGHQQRDVIDALRQLMTLPDVVFIEKLIKERRVVPAADWPAGHSRARTDGLALIQYTGGTTGTAKGVELTHEAVVTNVLQREDLLPLSLNCERILCVMPLFHSYAMAMALFSAARARGTLVIMARYRPAELMGLIQREGITVFPGSPTIYSGLMAHPEFSSTDWSTVHTCYSGSAALPAALLERWETSVQAPIYEGYGQTEAGPILTFNQVEHRKAGSVGIPVKGTEVQIVDLIAGETVLGVGEVGEIRARGPQIMRAYRNRPEETAASLRGGWLYTSDIGEFDEEGYLYIRDRKKDLVITGGYNVYPREVEEVLLGHPLVLEAAVVGNPDDYRGEVLNAYVVICDTPTPQDEIRDELLSHCALNLAKYKVPSAVQILSSIPKTAVNKIDKAALRRVSSG